MLSSMNKLAVQPHEDSSARQESGFDVPLMEIITPPANHSCAIPQDTAQCIQPLRDSSVDMSQHTQFTSDEFTVDADVDV